LNKTFPDIEILFRYRIIKSLTDVMWSDKRNAFTLYKDWYFQFKTARFFISL